MQRDVSLSTRRSATDRLLSTDYSCFGNRPLIDLNLQSFMDTIDVAFTSVCKDDLMRSALCSPLVGGSQSKKQRTMGCRLNNLAGHRPSVDG